MRWIGCDGGGASARRPAGPGEAPNREHSWRSSVEKWRSSALRDTARHGLFPLCAGRSGGRKKGSKRGRKRNLGSNDHFPQLGSLFGGLRSGEFSPPSSRSPRRRPSTASASPESSRRSRRLWGSRTHPGLRRDEGSAGQLLARLGLPDEPLGQGEVGCRDGPAGCAAPRRSWPAPRCRPRTSGRRARPASHSRRPRRHRCRRRAGPCLPRGSSNPR